MRTTIEIRDEHRARLLDLAARRGEKGFSGLIAEAIEHFLAEHEHDREARSLALAARGSLIAEEAEALERATRAIREHWR